MRSLARAVRAAGLLGLLACAVFALLGLPSITSVDRILSSTDASLGTAAAAAREAADAFDGFDASLTEATTAAEDAAGLADRSAQTARDLANAMSLNVFGTQPFLGLAGGFQASADDLVALAGTLREMGGALDGNGKDLAALQVQLILLADQLEELAEPDRSVPPIMPAAVGLLVLLAIQSGGLLAAGLALSRLDASAAAAAAGR
jgi:hypothetical protein